MSKLTVENIICIYGGRVKEVKTYSEARRAKTEDFLQIEPVAFALSDEPDVLRIYVDKKSAEASLDGTLEEYEEQQEAAKDAAEDKEAAYKERRKQVISVYMRWFTGSLMKC